MSFVVRRLASTASKFTPERPEEIRQLLKPIGLLSRPMPGVEHGSGKTLQQRKDDFLDVKKNRIRREELKAEFAKSSFEPIYQFRHTGGKIFTAPPSIFKSKDALYMANIQGNRLDDSARTESTLCLLMSSTQPNLVRIFSSTIGQQQINQFTEDLDLRSLGVRLVDVNVATNWINRLLVKWFAGKIRKQQIGENGDVHKYLLAKGKLDKSVRKSIAASNELAGYLYVVDKNGKIRWATSGPIYGDEKERMLQVIEELKSDTS